MDKNTQIIILYDYYKKLLNEREQHYFEDYYFNNLTLAEISENMEVSRNNVHKTLKGIELKLEEYETKLNLYEKSIKLEKIMNKIKDNDILNQLKELI